MGARGPLPKADVSGRRLRTNNLVTLPARAMSKMPAPNSKWLAPTKKAWVAYWSSGLIAHTLDVDEPTIEGYFRAYDLWQKMMSEWEGEPFTEGSMGQTRVNPAADMAHRLRQEMDGLATQLGVTPYARQKLGIAIGRHKLTADDLNRRLREDDGGSEQAEGIEVLEGDFH